MKKPALVPFIGMIFLALFLAGRMGEGAETSSSPPDAVLLKEKARQKNLANHPTWRRLLHYRPSLLGFPRSDIDGPNFFLSKRGRRDPQAELDATLDAFFSPPPP
ncbi:MAG: hypothetical protein LHV69_11790, partial [Elusimicrobia bacterium]|nr:hypothetical protein [Candidatus Obscuribacterium magneticum]